MDEKEYAITKLANIALQLLNKYCVVEEMVIKENSWFEAEELEALVRWREDQRNEIYKVAGWLYHDKN